MSCNIAYKRNSLCVNGIDHLGTTKTPNFLDKSCEWDEAIHNLWSLKPAESNLSLTKSQENNSDLAVQLLLSQALLHSHEFKFMSFNDLELLKNEYKSLQQYEEYLRQCVELERRIHIINCLWDSFPNQKLCLLKNRWDFIISRMYFIRKDILKHSSAVLCQGIHIQIKETEEIEQYARKVLQKFEKYLYLKQANMKLNHYWKSLEKMTIRRKGLLTEMYQYKREYCDLIDFLKNKKNTHPTKFNKNEVLQNSRKIMDKSNIYKREGMWIQNSNIACLVKHNLDEPSTPIQKIEKKTNINCLEIPVLYKTEESQWADKENLENCLKNSVVGCEKNFAKTQNLKPCQTKHYDVLQQMTVKVQKLKKELSEEKIKAVQAASEPELREKLRTILSSLQVMYDRQLLQEVQERHILEKEIESINQQSVDELRSI